MIYLACVSIAVAGALAWLAYREREWLAREIWGINLLYEHAADPEPIFTIKPAHRPSPLVLVSHWVKLRKWGKRHATRDGEKTVCDIRIGMDKVARANRPAGLCCQCTRRLLFEGGRQFLERAHEVVR